MLFLPFVSSPALDFLPSFLRFPFYVLLSRLREGLNSVKENQPVLVFCEKKRPRYPLAPDIFRFCLSPMLACLLACLRFRAVSAHFPSLSRWCCVSSPRSLGCVAIFIHLSVKAILLSLYLLSSSSSSSCLLISLSIISTSVCVPYLIHVCAPHSSLPLPLLPIHPVLDLDV